MLDTNIQKKKLRFIGIDYWDRPVYQDESGELCAPVGRGRVPGKALPKRKGQ